LDESDVEDDVEGDDDVGELVVVNVEVGEVVVVVVVLVVVMPSQVVRCRRCTT
jgi:hypothetical protein